MICVGEDMLGGNFSRATTAGDPTLLFTTVSMYTSPLHRGLNSSIQLCQSDLINNRGPVLTTGNNPTGANNPTNIYNEKISLAILS